MTEQTTDSTMEWSMFTSVNNLAAQRMRTTWPELCRHVKQAPAYPSKQACRLLKLATFNGPRCNDNMAEISGIEGDYDSGQVTQAQAIAMLEAAGVRAVVYASPSASPTTHRWRVLAPTSKPYPPEARAGLVARLNGVLGGILAGESFTDSQVHYIGRTPVNSDVFAPAVTFNDPEAGQFLDLLPELEAGAIGKVSNKPGTPAPPARAGTSASHAPAVPVEWASEQTLRDLRSALAAMRCDDRAIWIDMGHALKTLGDRGRGLWIEWGQTSEKWQPEDARLWDGFNPTKTSWKAVFTRAEQFGWVNPARKVQPPPEVDFGALLANARNNVVDWPTFEPDDWEEPAQQPAPTAATAEHPGSDEPQYLKPVSVLDVLTSPSPAPAFVWRGYLPKREVTLLSAHGGSGKSFISLMLACAVATGRPLFDIPTAQAPALVVSCEDGGHVVRHRLAVICEKLAIQPQNLANLHVVDGTENPELFTADNTRNGPGEVTPVYVELAKLAMRIKPGLIIVDNISDIFGADEINRRQVRGFMRSMAEIAKHVDCAVVLLAHVAKVTSRKDTHGESYSGSTAWHNSARSRLFLSRERGLIKLLHEKSTHGQACDELRLVWPEGGLPQLPMNFDGLNAAQAGREADNNAAELLKVVAEFESRGEFVSTSKTARNNAVATLKSAFKAMGKDELTELVRQCERAQWLAKLEYQSPHRKPLERWTVTQQGRNFAGLPPLITPPPSTLPGRCDEVAPEPEIAPTAPTCHVSAQGAQGAKGL